MLFVSVFNVEVNPFLGQHILGRMARESVSRQLPTSLAAVWPLLRDCITLAERLVDATLTTRFDDWRTWVFIYLVICLTVRMAALLFLLLTSLAVRGVVGLIKILFGQEKAG
ncbi:MAG: hypothetical protein JXA69_14405 [Phycisphaerae bacterium]|nr:hypothetical protein [Phycisphaerae bacterium]